MPLQTPLARAAEYFFLNTNHPHVIHKPKTAWKPPNKGLKLNFDGSYNHRTKTAGANDMQVTQLEIATDSLEVINSLDSFAQTNNNLILSCRDLLLSLGSPMLLHEPRRYNSVADKLAK